MNMLTGPLGFTIPQQTLKTGKTLSFTPADVLTWRNHLTMSELSDTTKKLYFTLIESNETAIATKD